MVYGALGRPMVYGLNMEYQSVLNITLKISKLKNYHLKHYLHIIRSICIMYLLPIVVFYLGGERVPLFWPPPPL